MIKLLKQLYPKGGSLLAFLNDSVADNLHQALASEMQRVRDFASDSFESYIPDNDNFTIEDIRFWERKYGIFVNESLSLSLRRSRIADKIRYPGGLIYRQSLDYIESQLRAYGFNVRVYENSTSQTPQEAFGSLVNAFQYGTSQYGSSSMGVANLEIIANQSNIGESVSVGVGNNWASFFIAGESLTSLSQIAKVRRVEFRNLVLSLKPAQLVAFGLMSFLDSFIERVENDNGTIVLNPCVPIEFVYPEPQIETFRIRVSNDSGILVSNPCVPREFTHPKIQ